jgi:hypothetical protein
VGATRNNQNEENRTMIKKKQSRSLSPNSAAIRQSDTAHPSCQRNQSASIPLQSPYRRSSRPGIVVATNRFGSVGGRHGYR